MLINRKDQEKIDVDNIISNISVGESLGSLVEWENSKSNDTIFSFKNKGRLAYFVISDVSVHGYYLKSITYVVNSFQKSIYTQVKGEKYLMPYGSRFVVWSSEDKMTHYFCLIDPGSIKIWVYSHGNEVNFYSSNI